MAAACVHLIFLHQTGSNNPLGIDSDAERIPFHGYFSTKDALGYIIVLFIFLSLLIFAPNIFTDPENYIKANPLVTPTHIQPE
jgi:ubiquinol-cytochrome c reductase cytochrome b subunit